MNTWRMNRPSLTDIISTQLSHLNDLPWLSDHLQCFGFSSVIFSSFSALFPVFHDIFTFLHPSWLLLFLHYFAQTFWPHKWKHLSCSPSIFCTGSTITVLSCLLPSMYYSLHADMLSLGHLSLLFPLSINISIFTTDFPFCFSLCM